MYSTTVAWVIHQPEFYSRLAKRKTLFKKKKNDMTSQLLLARRHVGDSETKLEQIL